MVMGYARTQNKEVLIKIQSTCDCIADEDPIQEMGYVGIAFFDGKKIKGVRKKDRSNSL